MEGAGPSGPVDYPLRTGRGRHLGFLCNVHLKRHQKTRKVLPTPKQIFVGIRWAEKQEAKTYRLSGPTYIRSPRSHNQRNPASAGQEFAPPPNASFWTVWWHCATLCLHSFHAGTRGAMVVMKEITFIEKTRLVLVPWGPEGN